ncbi:MAG: hypothetical protein H6R18_398 [Proteobacteria bacterium]|nr:hypothetical protein [Pseudomonadota bacterium]
MDNICDVALGELGAKIGIPSLKFDSAGCCQLAFDSRWLVTMIHAPAVQRLVLSCLLSSSDGLNNARTLVSMLRANFLGSGCAGGSLGVSPDGKPCLQYQLAYAELGEQVLLARIESLLDQAELWSERLQRGESDSAPGAEKTKHGLIDGGLAPSWMLGRV